MLHKQISTELLETLLEWESRRVIEAFGVGTSGEEAAAVATKYPSLGRVQQTCWNVLEPRLEVSCADMFITHGAIGPVVKTLDARLARLMTLRDEWSREIDADLSDNSVLSDLLLAASLAENPNGLVLVASRRPDRIKRFVRVASDSNLQSKGTAFRELVGRLAAASLLRSFSG